MNKLFLVLFTLVLLFCPSVSKAENLASCSNPEGHSYYIDNSDISAKYKQAGWQEDKIAPGLTELQKINNGYDISYVDSRGKEAYSVIKDDNAKVVLVNKSEGDMSFLVQYPSGGIDIYRFFKEKNDVQKFSILSMRTQIPKSSLMVGNCSYIKFTE